MSLVDVVTANQIYRSEEFHWLLVSTSFVIWSLSRGWRGGTSHEAVLFRNNQLDFILDLTLLDFIVIRKKGRQLTIWLTLMAPTQEHHVHVLYCIYVLIDIGSFQTIAILIVDFSFFITGWNRAGASSYAYAWSSQCRNLKIPEPEQRARASGLGVTPPLCLSNQRSASPVAVRKRDFLDKCFKNKNQQAD